MSNLNIPLDAEMALASLSLLIIIYLASSSMIDKAHTSPDVSPQKQKSWVITCVSSFILTFVGFYSTLDALYNDKFNFDHIYGGEDVYSRFVVIFFTCVNIVDLAMGYMYYPSHMDTMTTIVHHYFYIGFMLTLLSLNYSRGFLLCFAMEAPTFVLSVGSIFPSYRSDFTFGFSFVLTRLIYNAFLAYQLYLVTPSGYIWRVCVLVLTVHMYWFYKWWYLYGYKAVMNWEASIVEMIGSIGRFK